MNLSDIPMDTWLMIFGGLAVVLLILAAVNKSKKGHIKTDNKKDE